MKDWIFIVMNSGPKPLKTDNKEHTLYTLGRLHGDECLGMFLARGTRFRVYCRLIAWSFRVLKSPVGLVFDNVWLMSV